MTHDTAHSLPFMKMHGLGNDFVVIDARAQAIEVSARMAQAIADRHRGVGFDQLAILSRNEADGHLSFLNADGSPSVTCGNATRCIARWLMDQTGKTAMTFTTDHGRIETQDAGDGKTAVNMGKPHITWDTIPLAEEVDTLRLPIEGAPAATSMGNPHCTFFVEDAEAVPLETFGPRYEHHPLYPNRTNVQVAQIIGPDRIRMRVWERGVGITLASGSSACATTVSAARLGLTGRRIDVVLDGGTLTVDWREDGVWQSGPTEHVFSGTFTADFLDSIT